MRAELVAYGSEEWEQARKIRHALFFEPYGLPVSILDDQYEKTSYHVVVKSEGVVTAYGRMHIESDVGHVSQMVVAPPFQGQGLGQLVLSALTALASEKGTASVVLNARSSAVSFYAKAGFKKVDGTFFSATTGVPHVRMELHFGRTL